ncbi:Aldehyde/histidinol dehydrogenase [Paraphoma chrysanthemicola]|nr:Aldehyde/histidinol dehydrogenase [Paraphoma chrysanthemicola]
MCDLVCTLLVSSPKGRKWNQLTGLFINNEFVDASNRTLITSIYPATEKEIVTVQGASSEDVDREVNAAKKALKSTEWKKLRVTERGRLMTKLADLIEENKELLATVDAWDDGPALACGNIIVLKAAEQTPLSILLLARFIKEAGFPPGVVKIINWIGREADKVAFTGSTGTATRIMKMAAVGLKNITLETHADMEQAICTATSRILVQLFVFEEILSQFREQIKSVSVIGDQWSDNTFEGPQVTKQQYERVLSYVDIGKSEGAELVEGGEACPGNGFFIKPTVFTKVSPNMRIYREEIFGPLVVIATLATEEDGIAMANDTIYGLGSAVFTRDLERAHRVAAEIEAGMVWINSSQDCDYRIPFGGVKQSGIGRELGEAGLQAYSQVKAVHVNLGNRL